MTTLTYRGHNYVQIKEACPKQEIKLTYRRAVYENRRDQAKENHPNLIYRGQAYQK